MSHKISKAKKTKASKKTKSKTSKKTKSKKVVKVKSTFFDHSEKTLTPKLDKSKLCPSCNLTKSSDQFGKRSMLDKKTNIRTIRLQTWCLKCRSKDSIVKTALKQKHKVLADLDLRTSIVRQDKKFSKMLGIVLKPKTIQKAKKIATKNKSKKKISVRNSRNPKGKRSSK